MTEKYAIFDAFLNHRKKGKKKTTFDLDAALAGEDAAPGAPQDNADSNSALGADEPDVDPDLDFGKNRKSWKRPFALDDLEGDTSASDEEGRAGGDGGFDMDLLDFGNMKKRMKMDLDELIAEQDVKKENEFMDYWIIKEEDVDEFEEDLENDISPLDTKAEIKKEILTEEIDIKDEDFTSILISSRVLHLYTVQHDHTYASKDNRTGRFDKSCDSRTKRIGNLGKHSGDTIKWFHCQQCNFKAKHTLNLKSHVRSEHTSKDKIKRFHCKQCDYKTVQEKVIKNHIISKHIPEDKIKWFHCKQCDYKAKILDVLERHVTIKHASDDKMNWFHCKQCDYKAIRRSHLKRHVICKHTTEDKIKWFHCKQCDYKAKILAFLKDHVTIKHASGDKMKRFHCKQCDYKAKRGCYLKSHIICKHTTKDKIKWIPCKQCDFKAKHSTYLQQHVAHKHPPEDKIKWFHCKQCDYKTNQGIHLKKHYVQTHKKKIKLSDFIAIANSVTLK